MLAASRLRRRGSRADYWPGFVDLMSTLLLVMIFLLVVYMLAQYFLQRSLSEETEARDSLSDKLSSQEKELADEKQANAALSLNIAQLSSQLQSSLSVRDQLIAELSMVTGERDTLQLRLKEMTGAGQTAMADAAQASIRADAGEEKVKILLSDIERLRRDIDALNAVRRDLESKVGVMAAALIESRGELGQSEDETAAVRADLSALRDTTAELEARLSDEQERTVLAQRTLEEREIRLAEVQALHLAAQSSYDSSQEALNENRALSARQRDQIAVLNQQIDALRSQLGRVERALQISELKSEEQDVTIANLGQRLNMALAAKVEELAAYRSEFFGRLREVLSERRDFNIIGDRFVFQSEVLFASASDQLEAEGHERLAQFAQVLREVMVQIPTELPWILQVDGHTDSRPIQTARFPSNWELSSARAISVVNFLIALGIPPDRLSATGYGEFQPLDDRDDEIAHRRNRRIELKLTQR